MALRFRQLQAFHAIIETGTVTGAAERLGISQPGVSNLISQLETETKLTLFERAKGRLQATPEAQILFRSADTVVRGLDHVAQAVDDLQNKEAGQLTVACPHHLSFGFMPEMISHFAASRADLSVSFQSNYSTKICEWVAAGLFEIGVCEASAVDPSLEARRYQFETVCALPKGSDLAALDVISPADLSGRALIVMGPEHMTHRRTKEAFQAAGAEFRPKVHTHLFENKLAFVTCGMGAALLDPFTIGFNRRADITTRPFVPTIALDLAIITARDRRLSTLGMEFLALLETEFSALALSAEE
ncbi:MAG: LysR family transcriptional regulator [Pseudomonadota bacterium]